ESLREVGDGMVGVAGPAARLLPVLLTAESGEVEERVRAAKHLGTAGEGRVRVKDAAAVAQEAADTRKLERLRGLDRRISPRLELLLAAVVALHRRDRLVDG